jgi:hypothetical protein
MVWYNGMFYCGIHIYKLSLLDNEYIRNIIYGLYVLYHHSQVKPDLRDILYMSHILPQTLGDDYMTH